MQFDSGLSRSGTCHSNQGKVIRVMTLDLPPLFSAGCRLTGGAKPYVMGLAGLEALRQAQGSRNPDLQLVELALPAGYCGALAWTQHSMEAPL